MLRFFKQRLKRALYAARGLKPDIKIPVTTVNPGDQAWYFADGTLKEGDIVYSLGLATNIEFDLNLIEKFGVEVHGFDPTPESVEWVRSQSLPPQFHHHAVAVAGHDGELTFQLPEKEGHCARAIGASDQKPEVRPQTPDLRSLTSELRTLTSDSRPSTLDPRPSTLTVPCKLISTLMRDLGHSRINLLKMDIEGSEYDVIDDILTNNLEVGQILVEFHHRFADIGMKKTLTAVAALRAAGYELFHISPWCEEYAFIKE